MISQEHRSPSDTRKALVPVTSNNNVYTKVHRSRHCTVGPPRRCRPRKCIVANGRQPAPVASLTFHTRTIEITIFKVLYVQHTSVLKCSLTSRWSQCLLDLEPESNTGHKSFPRFTIMLYRFAVTKSDLPSVSYDFMEDLRFVFPSRLPRLHFLYRVFHFFFLSLLWTSGRSMVLSIGPYTLLMFGEIDENEEVILWRGFARRE